MSLNYNLAEIKNFNTTCYIHRPAGDLTEAEAMQQGYGKGDAGDWVRINPLTEMLIFATMFIGINPITESNWEDFFRRVYAWERAHGALLTQKGEPVYLTPGDIREHIGLRTNASKITASKFSKAITEKLAERANASLEVSR